MATLGEIRKGVGVGYKWTYKYIYTACLGCGREQWVRLIKGKPVNRRCYSCANKGKRSPLWEDRHIKDRYGYVRVKLQSDDFFYPMAQRNGYVLEHRLVMAKHLNRCLLPREVVHHKGTKYPLGSIENKSDNRLGNLELLPASKYHLVDTVTKSYIKHLEKRIVLLESEMIALRCQLEQGVIIEK